MYYQHNKSAYHHNRVTPERDNVLKFEWRLGIIGLIFSIIILTAKVLYLNRDTIYDTIFEKRLITYERVVTDGEIIVNYAWTTALRYSKFWLPVLCGTLATWFTWLMVYLDSNIPGVQPPSPLSPSRYKIHSGHTFHLNYVFAFIIGLLVAIYMFTKGISIKL